MWMRVIVCAASLALAGEARAAGGAYVTDAADVGEIGNCKVESWASFASNQDFIGVANPSCVVDLTRPVELSTQLLRGRSDVVGILDQTGTLGRVWDIEFEPTGEPATNETGLTTVDHISQSMQYEEMLSWMLFYGSLLGWHHPVAMRCRVGS